MSNNEISANLNEALENIQEFVENVASAPAKYTIQIADNTGHTTADNLLVEEAVEKIIENAESNARWVFINGAKFEFDNGGFRTEANTQKLKARLEEEHNPTVLLTGILVGG